jgi:NADH-quinone oxidoreductase subunit D
VLRDLPPGFAGLVKEFLAGVYRLAGEYERLVLKNRIFAARTRGIGTLRADEAKRLGTSGPVLRSTGVSWDLRRSEPYSVYERFAFDVPVGTAGDCYDRTALRLEELRQSGRILEQALSSLPPGEVRAKAPASLRPPAGAVYTAVESPRGEVGAYLASDGGPKPYRLKWQAPSFNNLQIVSRLAPGHRLADLVAILGSIDIILGEVER